MPRRRRETAPADGRPEAAPAIRPRFRTGRWAAAAAVFLLLLGGLGVTEATGVTKVRGTVIRLFSPEGTLVVEVDDPGVSVKIDGADLVITGAGAKEIRLKPGQLHGRGQQGRQGRAPGTGHGHEERPAGRAGQPGGSAV